METSSSSHKQNGGGVGTVLAAEPPVPALDIITIIAIALVVYTLASILHEGFGHGLTCILTGGKLQVISSDHCECDEELISRNAQRMISAAGSIVNIITFGVCLLFSKLIEKRSPLLRYFCWLMMTVNILQAGGYLMISPFVGIGDWAAVIKGTSTPIIWKLLFTASGVAISLMGLFTAVKQIDPFIGSNVQLRNSRARLITIVPYLAGGLASTIAGATNHVGGIYLVLISAVAASFGGTCWLVWLPFWVKDPTNNTPATALPLTRNFIWIILGIISLIIHIAILGPGVKFN